MRRLLGAWLAAACAGARPDAESATVRVRVTMQDEAPAAPVAVAVARTPPAPPRVTPARPRREGPAETSPTCGFDAAPEARTPSMEEVSLGRGHSCARLTDGTVRCWGANLDGQTGDGHTGSDRGPAAPAQVPDVEGAAQVCVGFAYTCARYRDGAAECWGNNTHNQVNFSLRASCTARPVRAPVDRVRSLACGAWHVCAIRDDGSAWCWGEDAPRYSPWRVRLPGRVVELAAGRRRTCARTERGAVFCWTVTERAPAEVAGFPSPPTQLAVAERFACAALADGRAACWGDGYRGELGNGAPLESREPVTVPSLDGVTAVAAAEERACAVARGGALWCWGRDERRGATSRRGEESLAIVGPTRVEAVGPARAVALGEGHACARTVAGPLCCWGDNHYGQLGNNRTGPPGEAAGPSAVVW